MSPHSWVRFILSSGAQLKHRAVRQLAMRLRSIIAIPLLPAAGMMAGLTGLIGCSEGSSSDADTARLLAMHEEVLEAHRTGDVGAWLALEADEYVSANNGTVTFPTKADREANRTPYLAATTFLVYQDVRRPVVRVSADGTLGWLIAEVEVRGTQVIEDGGSTRIEAVWAWIELYRKDAGEWRLVGNVSNRRP